MAGTVDLARRGAVPGPWRERALRWRPPRLALALSALGGALHLLLWGAAAPWGSAPLPGAALALAGFGWMLWAYALHRAAGNPIRPTAAPQLLVDEGPFALGRHPMYLGLTAMLLGCALGLGSPALGVAAVAFAVLIDAVHIRHEEAQLAASFGGWWHDYASRVRRWL